MKKNYIGERITSLRMEKNISEYTLGKNIGKCNSYINKISSGIMNPSIDTLSAICDYFGISLSQFFDKETPELSLTALRIISLLPKLTEEQLQILLSVITSMRIEEHSRKLPCTNLGTKSFRDRSRG